jgi:hypothetical protein
MVSPPAVSVLVAAFKAHDYLRQAVASALSQTLGGIEVIISDDASDPEVERLALAFNDPRVVYRGNPRRRGPAGNHWAALAAARGAYVAILNHDDLWRPNFLASLVPPLEQNPGAVLAFCDHTVIDPSGSLLQDATEENTRKWGRDCLSPGMHRPFAGLVVRQTIPMAMGTVFRRSAVDARALPDVGPAYDLWLAHALCRGGGGAWYVPRRLTAWRTHPAQLTQGGAESWPSGGLACWQAMEQDSRYHAHLQVVRQRIAGCALALAKARLMQGDRRATRAQASLALRSAGPSWRALAILGLSVLPAAVARAVVRRG